MCDDLSCGAMGGAVIRVSLVLCLQILLALAQDPSRLFLFVREDEAQCVASGEAASSSLYWLHQDFIKSRSAYDANQQEKILKDQSYVHKFPASRFSCSFQQQDNRATCPGDRYLDLAGWTTEPALDEGWESLETEKTYTGVEDEVGILSKPHKLPDRPWTLGVSILTSNDSHIMLCDGRDPFNSKCYWLIVNGWSGTQSALRYCAQNRITATMYRPKSACTTRVANHKGNIAPRNDWLHLKIDYDNEMDLVVSYRNTKSKYVPFIRHMTASTPLNIEYMVMRTGGAYFDYSRGKWEGPSTAFWQINKNYGVLLLESTTQPSSIHDWFRTFNTTCLNILYNVVPKYAQSYSGRLVKVNYSSPSKNQNTRIILQGSLHPNLLLSDTLRVNSIEDCKRSGDLRVLNLTRTNNQKDLWKNVACASLNQFTTSVKYSKSTPINNADKIQVCTKLYGDDCAKTLMCNEETCGCVPGLRGDYCDRKCARGKYGFQCNADCSVECQDRICNHKDGKCTSCQNSNNSLPDCTQRPRDPCQPNPCGDNSECRVEDSVTLCRCKEHFIGSPTHCQPECYINLECESFRACVEGRCVDPCSSKSCVDGAQCHVAQHVAECKSFGNPLTRYDHPNQILLHY